MSKTVVEEFLRKDRQVVMTALAVVTVLAWAYLVMLTDEMEMTFTGGMKDMGAMMSLKPWTVSDALFMFIMWAVMMVGMMTPSAAPMILLYVRVVRKRFGSEDLAARTAAFFAGYVTVWIGFSATATAAQWGLERAALMSPMMTSSSAMFGGIVLIITGVYQWTPYKDACLKTCREPVWFLSRIWADAAAGAFRMGVTHGAFCVGCCWALMGLLFVAGVMNLVCVAAITVFVLLEKITPFGKRLGQAGSVIIVGIGVFMLSVGTNPF